MISADCPVLSTVAVVENSESSIALDLSVLSSVPLGEDNSVSTTSAAADSSVVPSPGVAK